MVGGWFAVGPSTAVTVACALAGGALTLPGLSWSAGTVSAAGSTTNALTLTGATMAAGSPTLTSSGAPVAIGASSSLLGTVTSTSAGVAFSFTGLVTVAGAVRSRV